MGMYWNQQMISQLVCGNDLSAAARRQADEIAEGEPH